MAAAPSRYPSARPTPSGPTDERELARSHTSGRPRATPGVVPCGTCDRLRTVEATEYYVLRLCTRCRLLAARRTPLRFESVSVINACFTAIERELAGINRAHFKLLVDTRGGPPSRNDPA